MEVKQLWQILRRRRAWALVVLASVIALGALITAMQPRAYLATSQLLIEREDRALSPLGGQLGQTGELSALSQKSSPLETQAALLRSAPIAELVIERLDLLDPATGDAMTVQAFLARGKVVPLKGTDILEISFRHPDPAIAQRAATTWALVFMEENRAGKRLGASESARFVADQVAEARAELAKAEAALRNFKLKHGTVRLGDEAQIDVQAVSNMEAALSQANAEQQAAAARARALRRQIGTSSARAFDAAALGQDPGMTRLRQQLLEAETHPSLTDASLGPAHPDVRQARARVESLRAALRREASQVLGHPSAGEASLDPARQAMAGALAQAEVDVLTHQSRAVALRGALSRIKGRLHQMPRLELDLTRLERDASLLAERYRSLKRHETEVGLQAVMRLGNVRVIQEALLPEQPDAPRPLFNMTVALLAGSVLGVGLAVFLDRLDESLRSVDAIDRALPLPSIARVPWMREAPGPIAALAPGSHVAESFRTLRTYVNMLAESPPRRLCVTSALPQEGKSTVATNLAIAYAQGGKKVLLVDADVRRASIHRVLGLGNRHGLTSLLKSGGDPHPACQQGPHPNLHVMTAGPQVDDVTAILDSPPFDSLLATLSERYDLIIVDTPPVLAVSDACVVGRRMDGAVLVVGVGKVTARAAQQALEALRAAGIRVLGNVAHGVRREEDPGAYAAYGYANLDAPTRLLPPAQAG